MLTSKNWIERLRHLFSRTTYYDNSFPSNCGEINPDGSISFDCIGLVKSVINEPDIVYKTAPAGYHVTPGQVIPDASEIGILNLCTDVKWGDFSNLVPGEYLYMAGHAGVYLGGGQVIECTTDWEGGCVCSGINQWGGRARNGIWGRSWEAHGKLSRYIDYSEQPQPAPQPEGLYIEYGVQEDINKQYLPLVINATDFAGEYGSDIIAIAARLSKGKTVKYRVHLWEGDREEYYGNPKWLDPVSGFNWKDSENGFAGDARPIDAFTIKADDPKIEILYRVHGRKTGRWYEWVSSYDSNIKDDELGYAGVIGDPIDGLQMMIVKH